MALDLYAGPLSRYHSGDWETIGQQMARADGVSVVTVRVGQGGGSPTPQNEVTEVLHRWRNATCSHLSGQGLATVTWSDEPTMPYLTDRPGWEGQTGLLFKYAYLKNPDLVPPIHVPPVDGNADDPGWRAATEEPSLFLILANCECWLPGDFQAMFEHATITGHRANFSSVGMLNLALDQVCELWQKERSDVELLSTDQPDSHAHLDEAALHGLAVFCRVASFAAKHSVPVILDY